MNSQTERPDWFDKLLLDEGLNKKLRGMAKKLYRGDVSRAEDLVTETQIKAMRFWDKFEIGTNFDAWMCTILNNTFLSEKRRENRVEYTDDPELAKSHRVSPNQIDALSLRELEDRIDKLPLEQREALKKVREGHSYEEVARETGVAVRTIKSRVSRARDNLGDPSLFIEDRS
jgi:RNA polymerase sigma-70 factor (ECF subfamily)